MELHRHGAKERHGDRLQSVQIMRGFAAIAVAFYHTHLILAQREYGELDVFGPLAVKGWLGVNFFFVLSGFIIFYAHANDLGKPDRLPRYLWRRFVRLYPVYWIVLTFYITSAAVGLGYPDFRWSAGNLLSAYTLVNVVADPTLPLKVAWTLFYELRFYVVFAVLLLSARAGFALLTLWAAAVLANSVVSFPMNWQILSMWNLYFPIGILSYWGVKRLSPSFGPFVLAGGIVTLVPLVWQIHGGISEYDDNPATLFLFTVPFAMILMGGVLSERLYKYDLPRWMILLGEASYSIYLVHSAILSVVAGVNHKLIFGRLPPVLVFLVAFAIAVTGGLIVHLMVERPLLSRLRRVEPRLRIMQPSMDH